MLATQDEMSRVQTPAPTEANRLEANAGLILDSALDYAIFTTDPKGLITEWPAGARAVFGWAADEILGRPATLLFTPEDLLSGEAERELERATRDGVAPDVRWHQHKDGRRIFIDGWTRSISDAGGRLRGFIKIGQDVTQRRQMESDLRESEERFRILATSVPHLVFRSYSTGERTWSSVQWEVYSGQSESMSRGLGWLQCIHPDDVDATRKAWVTAEQGEDYYVEHRIRRGGDNQYRWHQTRALPLQAAASGEREWVGTSADVHELRQLQEEQGLLVAELQHRTRNLLGVIQAITEQTIETSESLTAFRRKFTQRLTALSRVQDLLSRRRGAATQIRDLIGMELAAIGAEDRDGVHLEGPEVALPESAVQIVALAIHELATNARKYGALAGSGGQLQISWQKTDDTLRLLWIEKLSAEAQPVPRQASGGFGRKLLEDALPAALNARTSLSIAEGAVYCRIEIPCS
jgi:PAS domain S-box-containing protein